MSDPPTRATASGRAYLELQRLARRSGRSTQELLHLYVLQGFLARLAASQYSSQLVLKGGVLLAAYGTRRATRDIDLQGQHLVSEVDTVRTTIQDIASTGLADGIVFLPDAVARTIRDDAVYQGVRVDLTAQLATARVPFHVDVNVGDPIWPAPHRIILPGLLDRDIELLGYPLVMVHAEKIVTAVDRGPTNTRWRDFADIYTLSGQHPADGGELRRSVETVAVHRSVALAPLSRTLAGWVDTAQPRWAVWRRKQLLSDLVPSSFGEVLAAVAAFADPVLSGDSDGATWHPEHRAWLN